MIPSANPHHLLITAPRTASTMFVKMLNLDEQGVRSSNYGGYNFLPSMPKRYQLQPRPMSQWTDEELREVQNIMQTCFDNMQDFIEKSQEEKKLVFVKEHGILINHPWFESEFLHGECTTVGEPTPLMPRGAKTATRSEHNKTILSDEFLKTWRPTFLIRHPAMVFPSLFRLFRNEAFGRPTAEPNLIELTMYWQRKLFDFYEAQCATGDGGFIVLDADDLMVTPELVTKYTALVGLDPEKLRFSWEKVPQAVLDQLHPMVKGAHSSLNASDRVDVSKIAGHVDITAEAEKWKADFGENVATRIEKHVRDAMPDYEYMRSKRLTVA